MNQIHTGGEDKHMIDFLDFVERHAEQNIAFHLANADALRHEANVLLTVLLSGAGGALGLAAGTGGIERMSAIGLGVAGVYLFGVAALVVECCLKIRELQPPANEPAKLLSLADQSLEGVRHGELLNMQDRIDLIVKRNAFVGAWLNISRRLATATPIIFIAAVAAADCL